MANYSLVINSQFHPFSYSDFSAPIQESTKAQQDLENQYSDLSTKSNIWDNMVNQQTDKKSYAIYKKYSDDLAAQSAALAQEGLTPSSRQSLLNMRTRYSKEISPIEQAYLKRDQDIKRQQEISDKTGGRTLFTRNARTTTLDDYLDNKVNDYGQVNLDTIMNEGVLGGKAMSSRYFNTKEGKAFKGDYYELMKTQGMTPKAAYDILQRKGNYPEFERFINDELNKVSANKNNSLYSQEDRDKIEESLMQGLNMGIGYNESPQLVDNWRDKMYTEDALTRSRMAYAEQLKNMNKQAEGKQRIFTRLEEGRSGTVNKDLERIGDIIAGGNQSFTTLNLMKKTKEIQKIQNAINALNLTEKDKAAANAAEFSQKTSTGGAYGSIGAAMSNQMSSKYREYLNLKDKLNKANMEEASERKFIQGFMDKYPTLKGTQFERMSKAIQLEKQHQGMQNSSFALNFKESDYNNIRDGFINTLNGLTKEAVNSGQAGLVDANGHTLSYNNMKDLLDRKTKDELSFKVRNNINSTNFVVTKNGKEYTIKGIKQITDYDNNLSAVQNFLRNFRSDDIIKDENNVKSNWGVNPYLNYISQKDLNELSKGNFNPDRYKFAPLPKNGNLRGAALYEPTTGNVIKIIIDRNNRLVASNSMADELNGGENRDAYYMNMAGSGLGQTTNLFAQ